MHAHQTQISLVWKDIQQLNDVWPMQLFQQLNLPQRCDIDTFLGLSKVDLFYGNNLSSLYSRGKGILALRLQLMLPACGLLRYLLVSGLEDDTKGSLSKCCAFDIFIHTACPPSTPSTPRQRCDRELKLNHQ